MAEFLPWHHLRAPDALRALSSGKDGLGDEEAKERLIKEGRNVFVERKPTSSIAIFFRQFASPLLTVLGVAALLSGILGHWADVALILVIIFTNVLLGFFQEYKADRALYELENMLPPVAKVRRGGVIKEISAEEVVPGDIVVLRAGDKVTADGRILSSSAFTTNEAALTGESREVEKSEHPVPEGAALSDQSSMVFAGTIVSQGRAEILVVGTGKSTAFGRVTDLVQKTPESDTPLQKDLRAFSRQLAITMSGISILVLLLGYLRGIDFLFMITVAAALAVAAVPEGLLVSLTVILAAGMRRMLKRGALVRRMVAAETLGSVSVMCVDKTGTLTTGEMTVTELRSGARLLDLKNLDGQGKDVRLALTLLTEENGARLSSTEQAAAKFIAQYPLTENERTPYALISELPFDSRKKYSAKLWRKSDREELYVWGAPEMLLPKCDIDDVKLSAFHKVLGDMTGRGLRVLLVARREMREGEKLSDKSILDLEPLGFIGLEDPLRPHAKETLEQAKRAGVKTVMVTGDHPVTAAHVARALGLPAERANLLTGPELQEMTDDELSRRASAISVFARVLPEQKVRILEAYRRVGHVVAMTGDGVNDAPALRAADIGVAVGSGTDVAKETADMVILDNDVASIVAAIREGRIVFENVRKVTVYLLTFSLGEVAVISAAILLGFPLPFTPLHILWINLISDGLPAMSLAFEPGERGMMREGAREKNAAIISGPLKNLMFVIGGITVLSLVILLAFLVRNGESLEIIRTMLFLSLGLDSLFAIFVIRSFHKKSLTIGPLNNPFLFVSFALSLGLLILPISLPEMRSLFGFVLLPTASLFMLVSLTALKFLIFQVAKGFILFPHRRYREKLVS